MPRERRRSDGPVWGRRVRSAAKRSKGPERIGGAPQALTATTRWGLRAKSAIEAASTEYPPEIAAPRLQAVIVAAHEFG